MFASTFAPSFLPNPFSFAPAPVQKLTPSNCAVSVELYNTYRAFVLALMPLSSPDVYYKVFNNSDNKGVIGYGIHEKFVHNGFSVVDMSVGPLDFPWVMADAYRTNETTLATLITNLNQETNPVVAGRLRQLVQFIQILPHYTRIFYHQGDNGVRSLTIRDDLNEVKLNVVVSWLGK